MRTQQNHTSPIPRSASDLALASNKHAVVLALVCNSAASGKGSQHNFLDLGTLSPKGQKPGALWGRKRYHQERRQAKVHLGELRIHKGRSPRNRQYSSTTADSSSRPLFMSAVWRVPLWIISAKCSAELCPNTWQTSLNRDDVSRGFLMECQSIEALWSLVACSILCAVSRVTASDFMCSSSCLLSTNKHTDGSRL